MSNLDSAAVELATLSEVATLAAFARWILIEQDRLTTMVAAGLTRCQAEELMNLGD